MNLHPQVLTVFSVVLGVLILASLIGYILAKTKPGPVIDNLNARVRAWWVMVLIFVAALSTGHIGATALFAFISFLALREYITLTPSSRGDHQALFYSFFVFLPLQYVLVAMPWEGKTGWYGLFSILIPVYAFVGLPIRAALSGDTTSFLERTAKIQWGLMVCVYCVSYAPMLLTLDIRPEHHFEGRNPLLLLFLVIVVQSSDVLQYVWGKLCGRRKIVPSLSPNKTVEGFIGGILSASLLGVAMWKMTPFAWWQAGILSLIICLMGFCGGLVMSAIKRDRGVKDFGSMIEGHGGMLDRIDSLCFAAPIFFHLVRQFWV